MKADPSVITACTMDCPDACSMMVSIDATGKVRMRGNPDHPFTRGYTCKKIRRHIERLRSPERIVAPMRRQGSTWRSISWASALDLCAAHIEPLRQTPAAILHIQADGAKGVVKQATNLFFHLLGSTRTRGCVCDPAGFMACVHDFGSRRNHRLSDLAHARRIVNWGKDLSRSSIHLAEHVRRARTNGARVLTIGPGGDGNGSFTDDTIRIRPGTDRLLAAAVLQNILAAGVDEAIAARVKHLDGLGKALDAYSRQRLLTMCGADQNDLDTLCRYYISDAPTATIVGTGLQRYRFGGENVRFINALALLAGQIGRNGGGSYYHLHSLAPFNMQWAKTPPRRRRSFAKPLIAKEILAASDPAVAMIWINGMNVVNQVADSRAIAKAFEKVPFKVVVDAFFNDTAQRADLVLPAALMLEQEDLIGSFGHDYIHYVPAVLDPPGQARSDHWIVRQLAKRLDPPIELPTADQCMAASLDSPALDIGLDQLKQTGWVRSRNPEVVYRGLVFDHADGLARLPIQLHDEPDPPGDFPLRLLTLVRREAIHSQMLPDWQTQPPQVWVSPDCSALAQLDLQRSIDLVSPLGRMAVQLQTRDDLRPDVVVYRRGDWMKLGGGANQLIAALTTDIGTGTAFYDQYVRLENR